MENEFKCADCGPGRWPFDDKRGCFELEMQYMRWDSLLAIVPLCVACCGIMLTVAVIVIFMRHSETPIVKVTLSITSHRLLRVNVLELLICCWSSADNPMRLSLWEGLCSEAVL